ncbi:acyl-CoA dehydrogenase [Sphingomonas ginsenosidivorax]|uniref:Acyl-CoA dehydrogenase n=1 Tax=Sphingomonas ginsenosidivorax TaxID=862135 RepID=A0A5C6UBR4_9SPHN|nr:acyl-CoA dehydrogenase [Sphingomonas ginsenosidivorax]TXC70277.1 acyl-CoA dehydrogenase [Sphingomonas ginsenosidivorax]
MSMTRAELQDAARGAFGGDELAVDRWDRVVEMGWLTMTVPEAQGGLGLGREAAGVIHSEMGRTVVPDPAIAQALVIEALSAADAVPDRDDLLARAMGGEVMTASLSLGDALDCVPDADRASHVLSVTAERIALLPLAAATITPRATWDTTRRLFDVVPGTGGITLAEGPAAATLAERLQQTLLLALAADALGGAAAILERTIAYLEMRQQFGRPLALFQALKHRVADMKTWLSAAEALFWSRTTDPAATLAEIGALKAHACTVYCAIAEDAVQLHGGIGLTMEYYCHLFLKRAMLDAVLGSDADYWEERAGRRALRATG